MSGMSDHITTAGTMWQAEVSTFLAISSMPVRIITLQRMIWTTSSVYSQRRRVPNFVNLYLVGSGIPAATAGLLVAVYWASMMVGRFVGASIGSKVSARAMITTVSIATMVLVGFGMFAPQDQLVPFPGVDWATMTVITQPVPVGIFAMLLVGLCTSVMWGAIFNMAVEGLGKYTAIASGIFMTMVFGCAVMMGIQGFVADLYGYMASFWVVMFCAAYLLFYALIGSRVSKRAE